MFDRLMTPLRCLAWGMALSAATLAAAEGSLYERLGGKAGIASISDTLLDRMAHDPVTAPSFGPKVNMKRVKALFAEQLCDISGGPCRYSGDTMKQVHGGLGISEKAMYHTVALLRTVLDEQGIAQADKNALLAKLAPMKRDIVDTVAKPPAVP